MTSNRYSRRAKILPRPAICYPPPPPPPPPPACTLTIDNPVFHTQSHHLVWSITFHGRCPTPTASSLSLTNDGSDPLDPVAFPFTNFDTALVDQARTGDGLIHIHAVGQITGHPVVTLDTTAIA